MVIVTMAQNFFEEEDYSESLLKEPCEDRTHYLCNTEDFEFLIISTYFLVAIAANRSPPLKAICSNTIWKS